MWWDVLGWAIAIVFWIATIVEICKEQDRAD